MYVTYKNMVDPANPHDPNVRIIENPTDDDLTRAMLLWGMMAVNGFTIGNDSDVGLKDPIIRQKMADATGLSPYAIDQFVALAVGQKTHFGKVAQAFQTFATGDNGQGGAGYQGSSCPGSIGPFQNLAGNLPKPAHSARTAHFEESGGRTMP